MTPFAAKVLELAATQIGVREHGRNRGPEIDEYCREIGHDPEKRDPWCAIFVSAMVRRAATALGVQVPIRLTAGCFTLDEQAPVTMRTTTPAPGCIFLLQGHKHTGFLVELLPDGRWSTIEGNTNDGGSPEGDGVYARTRRRDELLCFVDLNEAPF
jgi:hypothetical protein